MDDEIARLSSLDDLVVAVGRGSRAALKRLYELEQRRLFGIALRIVRRPEIAAAMVRALKALGYRYVTLDLQGYRTGSLNEGLSLRPVS